MNPIDTRRSLYLDRTLPGVAYTGSSRLDRPFEPTHIANFAMNGARGIRSDLSDRWRTKHGDRQRKRGDRFLRSAN